MPINQKMMQSMQAQYGEKEGRRIYFAVETIQRLKEKKAMAKGKKKRRSKKTGHHKVTKGQKRAARSCASHIMAAKKNLDKAIKESHKL